MKLISVLFLSVFVSSDLHCTLRAVRRDVACPSLFMTVHWRRVSRVMLWMRTVGVRLGRMTVFSDWTLVQRYSDTGGSALQVQLNSAVPPTWTDTVWTWMTTSLGGTAKTQRKNHTWDLFNNSPRAPWSFVFSWADFCGNEKERSAYSERESLWRLKISASWCRWLHISLWGLCVEVRWRRAWTGEAGTDPGHAEAPCLRARCCHPFLHAPNSTTDRDARTDSSAWRSSSTSPAGLLSLVLGQWPRGDLAYLNSCESHAEYDVMILLYLRKSIT